MKLLVLNGPNLNLLGLREPGIYGAESYGSLVEKIQNYCDEKGVEVSFYQSNHEGCLVDKIQESYGNVDGIVFNPGAYTHTSIALLDALKAVGIPTVEVHISKLEQREEFRQISYIRSACVASIVGHGTDGYLEAVEILLQRGAKA
ncbi:MAG: type II 3-dehydroquinate dehydratase [Clostridia bacterium]|nr:type II 3-dehydroquinate dehydratase [Clostridia bacterium]